MSIALQASRLSPAWRALSLFQWFVILITVVSFVSTIFACAQWLGYSFWPTYDNRYTGLFYNPIVTGGFLGLTVVALACVRWWEPIPILLLGIGLAGSRGGWVVVGVGLLAIWVRNPLVILAILLGGAFYVTLNPSLSDLERLNIWYTAWVNLSWDGLGWGSFENLWIVRDGLGYNPQYAHNDYLQLVFEIGIFALPIFAILSFALLHTSAPAWPLLLAYAVLASFSPTSYVPELAVIGAVAFLAVVKHRLTTEE